MTRAPAGPAGSPISERKGTMNIIRRRVVNLFTASRKSSFNGIPFSDALNLNASTASIYSSNSAESLHFHRPVFTHRSFATFSPPGNNTYHGTAVYDDIDLSNNISEAAKVRSKPLLLSSSRRCKALLHPPKSTYLTQLRSEMRTQNQCSLSQLPLAVWV